MRYRQAQFLSSTLLAFGVALFGLACGRREEQSTGATAPATAVQPKLEVKPPRLPKPERPHIDPRATGIQRSNQQHLLEAYPERLATWEVECKLRDELVTPAPAAYAPESKGHSIRLTLSLKSQILRRGDSLWYKLQIQNIGSETVSIDDRFLSDGGVRYPTRLHALVTDTTGSEQAIPIGYLPWEDPDSWPVSDVEPGVLNLPGMETARTEEERAIILERWKAKDRFRVRLLPGEKLTSRSWRYVTYQEFKRNERAGLPENPHVPGEFRELWTSYKFDVPGSYRIRFVYKDEPRKPLSESDIDFLMRKGGKREDIIRRDAAVRFLHLGTVSSPAVSFEVVR